MNNEEIMISKPLENMSGGGYKVLSLFDGISCGIEALNRAGIKIKKYYASEIDKYALKVVQERHPEIIQLGDIKRWREWDIEQPDLIIGGFPCTGVSIAQTAKARTLKGTESELYYDMKDVLNHYKPKYFLVENNHGIPETVKEIVTEGLGVEPVMIDSALLSPQRRKRLYWTNIPDVTIPEDKYIKVKDIIDHGFVKENHIDKARFNQKDDTENNNKLVRIGTIGKGGQGERIYSINGKSCALVANSGGLGSNTGLYLIDGAVRKLNPLEAERLQTLPDNYTDVDGVPETQRYKCIGNGWTVDVIAHILKGLR